MPTRKSSKGILCNQRGQGFAEYLLVLFFVLGVVFVAARPIIAKIQGQLGAALQQGMFSNDPTGANFYYFPLK